MGLLEYAKWFCCDGAVLLSSFPHWFSLFEECSCTFLPRSDCANCLASDVEWVPLSSEGVIETFTVSHLKPQGFEHYKEPYIIAIVRTPEGVKVMGWLEGVDIEKISVGLVGQRARITTATKPDGYLAIVFKLLEEKGGK